MLQPFNAYRLLRNINPSPYMFYIHLKDFQLVGASPETLMKVRYICCAVLCCAVLHCTRAGQATCNPGYTGHASDPSSPFCSVLFVLAQCIGGVVENHPIAGTRRRGRTAAEDQALATELLADEKERAEHIMLVDLGRNDVYGCHADGCTVTVSAH
jgi:anthranilate synthase component 1